jgi:hypothetical protein
MAALLTSFLDECQAVEDAAWDVYIDRQLQQNLAFGDLLDKLGGLVGQGREGFIDNVYNLLIRARIATNRSSGRRTAILRVATLLLPGTAIEAREYVGAVVITGYGPVTVPAATIEDEFLERAKMAGVRMSFVWLGTPLASTILGGYAFRPDLITTPTAAQSPGYDGTITGGLLAGEMTQDEGAVS